MPPLREFLRLAHATGTENEGRSAWQTGSDRYVPMLQILLGFLRRYWPIPRLFGWAAVTLSDDVEEVLSLPNVFSTPFAEEMARLNDGARPGTQFLAMDDAHAHDAQVRQVMDAFRREDVKERVGDVANRKAAAIVAAANGRLEAIGGLITQVPLDICVDYYGIAIDDPKRFTEAFMVVSGHLFGPPPVVQNDAVDQAAAYVRQVVSQAFEAERQRPRGTHTVIGRLLGTVKGGGITYLEAHAFLSGMILGFVPTDTMAGGHILEMLLRRPGFLAASQAAARAGDDVLLGRCLFEALRFMPINPGPFRVCAADYIVAAGTSRETRIRKGTKVLACTMSAMFDSRKVNNPFNFVPGRPASDLMNFGFGMHWCVGAFIAQTQIVQTFKPLLLQSGLRRAPGPDGQLKLRHTFPASLVVEFEVAS